MAVQLEPVLAQMLGKNKEGKIRNKEVRSE